MCADLNIQASSTREVNDLCFVVCDTVKEYFDNAAADYGEFGNIFALFFHDLVIHFTGIVLHRNALGEYPALESFPWVNKNYARMPARVVFDDRNQQKKEDPSIVKQLLKGWGLIPVAYGVSAQLVPSRHVFQNHALKVLLQSASGSQAFLVKKDHQVSHLRDLISVLSRLLDLDNEKIVWANWYDYAESFITSQQKSIKSKGVFVGTRNNLQNRIHAINFRQQGRPVVGFTHGEITNSVFDEPVFAYSDKTLCSTLVDYGSFTPTEEMYPAIIKPAQVLRRSSPVVSSLYRPKADIQNRDLAVSQTLLIPTVYQGNCIYGPAHAYETDVYHKWHLAIASVVPNLTIKLHPKTRIKKEFPCNTDYRKLEECIEEYDVILFDFFSTAGVLAVFSDKPVIYFNIGLRRLHPVFESALRRRCTTIDIDFEASWEPQIRTGLAQYDQTRHTVSNLEFGQYSLATQPDFGLWSTIADIMRSSQE